MTVCGEKVTGVCVAGKCPHIKRCCPVVWDKYGKIKPQTNEEWLCQLSTEEKAGFISAVLDYGFGIDYKPINPMGENVHTKEDIERWLKEKHNA